MRLFPAGKETVFVVRLQGLLKLLGDGGGGAAVGGAGTAVARAAGAPRKGLTDDSLLRAMVEFVSLRSIR